MKRSKNFITLSIYIKKVIFYLTSTHNLIGIKHYYYEMS